MDPCDACAVMPEPQLLPHAAPMTITPMAVEAPVVERYPTAVTLSSTTFLERRPLLPRQSTTYGERFKAFYESGRAVPVLYSMEATVGVGAVATMMMRPQEIVLPHRLLCSDPELLRAFTVCDVRVGMNSVLGSRSLSTPLSTLVEFTKWDEMIGHLQPMQELRMAVQNISGAHHVFRCVWECVVMRDQRP